MLRAIFWSLLARPSYWLYLTGLPSGYGYVSGKQMRAILDRDLRGVPKKHFDETDFH